MWGKWRNWELGLEPLQEARRRGQGDYAVSGFKVDITRWSVLGDGDRLRKGRDIKWVQMYLRASGRSFGGRWHLIWHGGVEPKGLFPCCITVKEIRIFILISATSKWLTSRCNSLCGDPWEAVMYQWASLYLTQQMQEPWRLMDAKLARPQLYSTKPKYSNCIKYFEFRNYYSCLTAWD